MVVVVKKVKAKKTQAQSATADDGFNTGGDATIEPAVTPNDNTNANTNTETDNTNTNPNTDNTNTDPVNNNVQQDPTTPEQGNTNMVVTSSIANPTNVPNTTPSVGSTANPGSNSKTDGNSNSKAGNSNSSSVTYITIGSGAALLIFALVLFMFLRKRKRNYNKNELARVKSDKSESVYQISSEFLKTDNHISLPFNETPQESTVLSESNFYHNDSTVLGNRLKDDDYKKNLGRKEANRGNDVNIEMDYNTNPVMHASSKEFLLGEQKKEKLYGSNQSNTDGSSDVNQYCIEMKFETPTLGISFPRPTHKASSSSSGWLNLDPSNKTMKPSSLSESTPNPNLTPNQSQSYTPNPNLTPNPNNTPKQNPNLTPVQNHTPKQNPNLTPIQNHTPKQNPNLTPVQNHTPKQNPNLTPVQNHTPNPNLTPIQNHTPIHSPLHSPLYSPNTNRIQNSNLAPNPSNELSEKPCPSPQRYAKNVNRQEQALNEVTEKPMISSPAAIVATEESKNEERATRGSPISAIKSKPAKPSPITTADINNSIGMGTGNSSSTGTSASAAASTSALINHEKSSDSYNNSSSNVIVKHSPQTHLAPKKSILKKNTNNRNYSGSSNTSNSNSNTNNTTLSRSASTKNNTTLSRSASGRKATLNRTTSTKSAKTTKTVNSSFTGNTSNTGNVSGVMDYNNSMEDDFSVHTLSRANSVATSASGMTIMRAPPVLSAFHHALPTPPTPKSTRFGTETELPTNQPNEDLMVPDVLTDAIGGRDIYNNQVRNIAGSYCTIRRNKNRRPAGSDDNVSGGRSATLDRKSSGHRRNRSQDYPHAKSRADYYNNKASYDKQELTSFKDLDKENFNPNHKDSNEASRNKNLHYTKTLPRHFGSSRQENEIDNEKEASVTKSHAFPINNGKSRSNKKSAKSGSSKHVRRNSMEAEFLVQNSNLSLTCFEEDLLKASITEKNKLRDVNSVLSILREERALLDQPTMMAPY